MLSINKMLLPAVRRFVGDTSSSLLHSIVISLKQAMANKSFTRSIKFINTVVFIYECLVTDK